MDKAKIIIRLIEESDIPQVAKIYADSFNKAKIGENWGKENSEIFIKYYFHRQPDLFFIALMKEKIVGGAVAFVKPFQRAGWYNLVESELFVDPEFQGQGVATSLMKALLKGATEKYEIDRFGGIANGVNDFPMKWYKSIGFNPTDWVYFDGDVKDMLAKLESGQNQ